MTSGRDRSRTVALGVAIGTTLLLAVGAAVGAVPRLAEGGPAPAVVAGPTTSTAAIAIAESPAAAATVAVAAPAPAAPPPTEPLATTVPVPAPPPVTIPAPAPPPPAPVAPGVRIEASPAQLRAAISQLRQRVPLFSPTEAQLRAFAEAACALFDQGQTRSQVEAAVRQAVSYVEGASLAPADAAFAVELALGLRCPGYG